MPLATINAVWIGPKLGPVHVACLRSFLRHGHRVTLHVYERPSDMPEGIEIADANELLPASRVVRHSRRNSPAIFADLLRHEILGKGLGLYVDCDVFCLRPFEDEDYIFGYETTDVVCNAVLKLPQNCPVVDHLCRLKDDAVIPPWAGPKRQMYYRWRAMLGLPVKIQDMPWGYTGPYALTWHLKQHGLERHAAPIDAFYPVHFCQLPLLLDPGLCIETITTPRTRLLHLWNEGLRKIDLTQVPATSPLGRVLAS